MRPRQYFREFWALKDISFEVKKGETVGIIGRNGAGKSTLLQILCGTLYPTGGAVETKGSVAALLELGSGFNPEFTGRENVYLNAAVWGLSREEVEARFERILEFAEIGDFIEQPVKTYSSGMMMRLAFAVIAHVDADVLIIDEALSVGDAFFTQKCMRFLRQFMERGTVLFVSHDTGAVINLCERAIWLQSGEVYGDGSPKDLTDKYLEDVLRARQGGGESVISNVRKVGTNTGEIKPRIDQRLELINSTKYRNDIELFEFDPFARGFGTNKVKIIEVGLFDGSDSPLLWCVGGEDVALRIQCAVNEALFSPIVGFYIKDRLGQTLFGANTYISYHDSPISVSTGEVLQADFRFAMPILPVGDYSICVAVAEGTQAEQVQHQWIHDALLFKSHASSELTALVGIPMRNVSLEKVESAS